MEMRIKRQTAQNIFLIWLIIAFVVTNYAWYRTGYSNGYQACENDVAKIIKFIPKK